MERGGGGRLIEAQGVQRGVRFRLRRRGVGARARRLLDQRGDFLQVLAGGVARFDRFAPAKIGARRFGAADVARQIAIARRLPGLTLEGGLLRFKLADHLIEALKILLCGAQTQLRLVPARVKAGDAGRFFEQAPAVLRLGADEF